jgi:hypothetical protein
MATIFRFAPRAGAAIDPRLDTSVSAVEFGIGRSPKSGLRLMRAGVRFTHAVMREEPGGLFVQAVGDAPLEQVGKGAGRAVLARPGDAFALGAFTFTLVAPGASGEKIVHVVPDAVTADDESAVAAWYRRAFDVALPNVRLLGFGLFVAVTALFFILPLAVAPAPHVIAPAASNLVQADARPAPAATAMLTELWNVGAISSAHSAFAGNCAYCHQSPFMHVQSSACLACHRATGQHADPMIAPIADLSKQRCEDCHREHKGLKLATRDQQSDCVTCHSDLKSVAPMTRLRPVRGFDSMTDHPQFAAALVQDAALHTRFRAEVGTPDPPDHSGLKFTHAKHLALDSFKDKMGDSACATCHVPAAGGVTFRPVEFEQSCASSNCHTLQFEPLHPEWRLPHGHPEEVSSRIAGFYARAALAGERFPEPRSDLFAKPGAPLPPPALTGAALVSSQTAAAMMSSIARSACGQCHLVTMPRAGEPDDAWKVAPVFVPDRYYTRALFSHASHATTPCASCHTARASDGGPLALLTGIKTCMECHAGEAGGVQRLASPCVSCHVFHDSTHPIVPQAKPATIALTRAGTEEP